jgi:ABC-type Fe3+ transport system substrate-binding protein
MNQDKKLEAYTMHGLAKQWEKQPDRHRHNKEKEWIKKVKSARTNKFYQAEDLIRRELVPSDWQPLTKMKMGKVSQSNIQEMRFKVLQESI